MSPKVNYNSILKNSIIYSIWYIILKHKYFINLGYVVFYILYSVITTIDLIYSFSDENEINILWE